MWYFSFTLSSQITVHLLGLLYHPPLGTLSTLTSPFSASSAQAAERFCQNASQTFSVLCSELCNKFGINRYSHLHKKSKTTGTYYIQQGTIFTTFCSPIMNGKESETDPSKRWVTLLHAWNQQNSANYTSTQIKKTLKSFINGWLSSTNICFYPYHLSGTFSSKKKYYIHAHTYALHIKINI